MWGNENLLEKIVHQVRREKKKKFFFRLSDHVIYCFSSCIKVCIRTTPQEDNSPPYRFWSWWIVLFRGSGHSGELSWWGIVLGIVVLVGNGWALFLSGGELSSWGVVLEPKQVIKLTIDSNFALFMKNCHEILNLIGYKMTLPWYMYM